MAPVAFYDLDKTVLAINGSRAWATYGYKRGLIKGSVLLKWTGDFLRYRMGLLDATGVMRQAIQMTAGQAETDLDSKFEQFFLEVIQHQVRPGAVASLAARRAAGTQCVLLTASADFLAKHVEEALGFDAMIATRMEVDSDGVLTGSPLEPMCYGDGKVELATEWLQTRGFTLEESVFYSDSYSDLPMLRAVGQPILVDPDPRLKRWGKKHNWAVEDWGLPEPTRS
jgi:HAD superfamily hydrolase (TIGR01490 family)